MYFDEDLVLDIRLNTLNNYVDKFVIAEATLDHSGKQKKLNFNIDNFSKFKAKINYIIIDDLPVDVSNYKKNWDPSHIRDQFQRNALTRGYNNYNDQDLIMISDIDEIPDPKKINEFKLENKYACFIQKNFQSKINQLNILEDDFDPNIVVDEFDISCLMVAVKMCNIDMVKLLLEYGADKNYKSNDGFTVQMIARRVGNREIQQLIRL